MDRIDSEQQRPSRAVHRDPTAERSPTPHVPDHPLLDLQRQAGNAAVAGLLAVQRHQLDPEEEAGS